MASIMALERCSEDLKEQFTAADLTIPQLEKLMAQFILDVKNGDFKLKSWPVYFETAYGVSKMGVTAMSIIQQKQLDSEGKEDIIVNACCPGYVDTDMTSHEGHKTIDQGADTPSYLALLPPNVTEPRGKYVSERMVEPWA